MAFAIKFRCTGMLSNPYPSLMIDNGLLCTEGSRVLVGLMDDIMTTCFVLHLCEGQS
jgi:hypothetical protein